MAPPPLTVRQTSLLLFVGAIFSFHGLWPLRHLLLYPSGVSWHEEGHLHAWHMKLRTKRGWSLVVAHEADGSRTIFDPESDPLLTHDQHGKVAVRPHAFMLYVTLVARLHMMAGRNLTAVYPYSCYSLNNRPAAPLYAPGVDLLDFVGKYELAVPLGSSGVGTWLTPIPSLTQQAACEVHSEYEATKQLNDNGAVAGDSYRLAQQAGIVRKGGAYFAPSGEYAYTQRWHRLDAQLAAYLASRPAP